MAWKLPIGRPNCTRSFAYWTVVRNRESAAPTTSAAWSTVATPSARSASAPPSAPPSPTTADLGTVTPSKRISANRRVRSSPARPRAERPLELPRARARAGSERRCRCRCGRRRGTCRPSCRRRRTGPRRRGGTRRRCRGRDDHGRVRLHVTVAGQAPGRDGVARRDARQHLGAHGVGPEPGDGVGDHVRRRERARVQDRTELLGQHHEVDEGLVGDAPAPVLRRDRRGEPSERRAVAPDVAVDDVVGLESRRARRG